MNHNINNCFEGELLTAYIYGELERPAIQKFEEHLLDCDQCQTEFSDLSEARLSVFEWNKFEFEPLSTPNIAIEYPQKSRIRTVWDSLIVPHRWTAAASFASVFIILGLVFVFFSGAENKTEIAASTISNIDTKPVAKNIEPKTILTTEPSLGVPAENRLDEGPEIVNISTRIQNVRQKPQKRENINKSRNSEMTKPIGTSAPVRLNNFEEFEDNSPRLSDLFDETEAS